jgi:hypothetical protein
MPRDPASPSRTHARRRGRAGGACASLGSGAKGDCSETGASLAHSGRFALSQPASLRDRAGCTVGPRLRAALEGRRELTGAGVASSTTPSVIGHVRLRAHGHVHGFALPCRSADSTRIVALCVSTPPHVVVTQQLRIETLLRVAP